jgi:hypothetical protein
MNVVNVGSPRLEPGATVVVRGTCWSSPSCRGGASLAGRIAAHVIGNAELSAQDRVEIAPVFPAPQE